MQMQRRAVEDGREGGFPEWKLFIECCLIRALNLTVMTDFTRRGKILGKIGRIRELRLHQNLSLKKLKKKKKKNKEDRNKS